MGKALGKKLRKELLEMEIEKSSEVSGLVEAEERQDQEEMHYEVVACILVFSFETISLFIPRKLSLALSSTSPL